MKLKVDELLNLYQDFQHLAATDQIIRLVYFHTVIEARETVSKEQLENLFDFAELPLPRNFPKLLAYLCKRGKKLLNKKGEYSLQRQARKGLEQELQELQGKPAPPRMAGGEAFDFPGRTFKDAKVSALLTEARKCYGQECWNACGILTRIIIERTLDSVDARVKAKQGLKDKINFCVGETTLFSQSVREGLKGFHAAKIVGDIAAHHSTIVLDGNDIGIVLAPFRMLMKEVQTI
jgi:hypothetical protein